jgi:hypothetical protein
VTLLLPLTPALGLEDSAGTANDLSANDEGIGCTTNPAAGEVGGIQVLRTHSESAEALPQRQLGDI